MGRPITAPDLITLGRPTVKRWRDLTSIRLGVNRVATKVRVTVASRDHVTSFGEITTLEPVMRLVRQGNLTDQGSLGKVAHLTEECRAGMPPELTLALPR